MQRPYSRNLKPIGRKIRAKAKSGTSALLSYTLIFLLRVCGIFSKMQRRRGKEEVASDSR